LVVAALAVAALAFFGYTSVVGDAVRKQDDFAQKQSDGIEAMGQQLVALEKENEFIGTLCEAHGRLQDELDNSREGTEQHRQAEEDLAATDQELAEIIDEDTASNIDWSKGWQQVMSEEKARHYQKIKALRQDLVNAKQAQLSYTQNQVQWTKDRIKALENEGNSWAALKRVIESFVHILGDGLMKIADFGEAARDALKDVPGLGKIVGFFGGDINTLGSGAISGARAKAASMQSWSAPDVVVNGFNTALTVSPLTQIPYLAAKGFYDYRHDSELEYQKADLEKLERKEAEIRAEYTQSKIDLLTRNGDTGSLPEDTGGSKEKGGGGRSPRGGSGGSGASEENALAKQYREAKKEFNAQLAELKTDRERKEERVTPVEEKDLYEKVIFQNGVNPYESLPEAKRDYANELTKSIKYMNEANKFARDSAEEQAKAMEDMAKAEVSFAEELGIMSKQDVWQYHNNKNEETYNAKNQNLMKH
jgi:hypothetical protein